MIDPAALKKARTGLLRLLGYRQRSRREAEEYLQRKGFDGDLIAVVLREMERWNYLDDRRYTLDCIESSLRRGFGPLRVRHTLISRGVHRDIIEEELARHYSLEKESSLARTLLKKRAASGNDPNEIRWIRRQAAYLKRRGFHDRVVARTIRECCHFPDD